MSVSAKLIAQLVALQAQVAAAQPLSSAPRAKLKAIELNAETLETNTTLALYNAAGKLDTPLASSQVSTPPNIVTVRKVFTDIGQSSWIVPLGVVSITAEAIGGGGSGGSAPPSLSYTGGGGGAYALSSNLGVSAGQTIFLNVGAGGATTTPGVGTGNGGISSWVNINLNAPPTLASLGVVADGGDAGSRGVILGGLNVNCIGDVAYSGGGSPMGGSANAGGGGAAGPTGPGANGGIPTGNCWGGSGGGGAGGGSIGAFTTSNNSGSAGGNGPNGTGGGAGGVLTFGGDAISTTGGGGGGGAGAPGTAPYAGGAGSTYFTPTWPIGYGPGGGGGASGAGLNSAHGGTAGLYGGGGGGTGVHGPATGGAGGQGIVVITYQSQIIVQSVLQSTNEIVSEFQAIVDSAKDQWQILDMLEVISRATLNLDLLLGDIDPGHLQTTLVPS